MDLSQRPPIRALISECLDQLVIGGRDANYAQFDTAIDLLRRLSKNAHVSGHELVTDIGHLARCFQDLNCSVPQEQDISNYMLFRQFMVSHVDGPRFMPAPEQLEDFHSRVKEVVTLLQNIKMAAGVLYPDPGYSKVFCGLLTYHLRHGGQSLESIVSDAKSLLSTAQLLQETLDQRLSSEFKARESQWAEDVGHQIAESNLNSILQSCLKRFRPRYQDALSLMSDYVAEVNSIVQSASGSELPGKLALSGANAYKYAFLLGLIDRERLSKVLIDSGGREVVIAVDMEALQLGALALARISYEYATIQGLTKRSERGLDGWMSDYSESVKLYDNIDTYEVNPYSLNRAEIFEEDYWNIASCVLIARAFRKNPCTSLRLEDSATGVQPFLSGIEYLAKFVRSAHASSGPPLYSES